MSRTKLITVSGSGHRAGKTRLVEKILPVLTDCAAVKASVSPGESPVVRREDDPDQSPGKDTGRYLAAGARLAYFVRGPAEKVRRAVREIIQDGGFATVVVESNSLVAELESDLHIYVRGCGSAKPGAEECERMADVVVSKLADRGEGKPMNEKRRGKVKEQVLAESRDGSIPCRTALELAQRLGVSPRRVGQAADEAGIKIVSCQLGCF